MKKKILFVILTGDVMKRIFALAVSVMAASVVFAGGVDNKNKPQRRLRKKPKPQYRMQEARSRIL